MLNPKNFGLFPQIVAALLRNDAIGIDGRWYHPYRSFNYTTSQPPPSFISNGIPFRIMFMGASITRGDVSTGNLGFRKPVRDKFVLAGNLVNLVGSQKLGDFKDNDLEAYPGNRIDQVHEHSIHIVPETKPNLFIIHVGTNDCLQNWDIANFGARMRDFVAYLLATSSRATVVMSTLITNTVPEVEPRILNVNSQIRQIASILQAEGKPVVLAEMHYDQGLPGRPQPSDISPDGTHPFDAGYAMMADIYWASVLEAERKGLFRSPEINGIPDDGDA
ncbi:SGNH hydrolase-type esterase domain-containing protein [Hypoxylon rubiginosum]|uniref:SGNH hydrolase-type esterase domain-containing protein n=1 Tax=Hypoxylon rubiginosum TaxID=110542 RepID=A0ACB9YHV4_9PEZI|nr:SGNH hydrolase-type esterase domain-containing protein [Hypoxylon rubiginosum]